MASGLLTVNVQIPEHTLTAADPDVVARALAKGLLDQARHQIGDTRQTSGELTHNAGDGNEVLGRWNWTPPAAS